MAAHGSLVALQDHLCTLGGLLASHKLIFTNGKRVENPSEWKWQRQPRFFYATAVTNLVTP